jgi:hypothetical protein
MTDFVGACLRRFNFPEKNFSFFRPLGACLQLFNLVIIKITLFLFRPWTSPLWVLKEVRPLRVFKEARPLRVFKEARPDFGPFGTECGSHN